ncbi:3-keto-5-aminohexanoate cleavage protein [Clostridiales bacterium PH28_bin88]|nr:3-keto-5-aminohexanoate cleavage protein [Clostridiales bacterium PH28_bin88]
MTRKVIITAAITGGIHTPTMSPYLPITPQQIIDDAVGAYEAGAAVVHIHSRTYEDGKPSADLEIMRKIISGIKKRCSVIICITTGGSLGMTIEQRIAAVPAFKPELASCNAGSVNFVLTPAAETVKKLGPKYDWEVPYLEGTYDLIFTNTFKGMEHYITTMNKNGVRPEFEVYDVGMINNVAFFLRKGLIKRPIYIQFVMGILGGIPATVDNLVYLYKTAREQLGEFNWSVAAAGRHQFPLTAAGLAMGGNVRVGLEDNLYLRPGVLAKSSGEQVTQIKEIAERLGLESATSDEARMILGLKGLEQVEF